MGAGRVVVQELKRIDDGLSSGELFKSLKWEALISNWKNNNSSLHFLGLLQDEGVHAHQEHLFKLMRQARKEFPEGRIVLHPYLDGRDTQPRSTLEYIARLNQELESVGNAVIGTVMGRYYGMDRSKNWALTSEAYECIVAAKGKKTASAEEAVKAEYATGKTPDGTEMTDEYIPCYIVGDYSGVKDGDSVMHTNYRQDRAIQLTQAFVCDDYQGTRSVRPKIVYLGFTRYWDEFEDYLLGAMGAGGGTVIHSHRIDQALEVIGVAGAIVTAYSEGMCIFGCLGQGKARRVSSRLMHAIYVKADACPTATDGYGIVMHAVKTDIRALG
jgi:2,3-bisphosphoglycerate-independent phosphoglycerate mutase